jgi:mannose-6-phosphate isomerase-like protein (cupin superfamily)
MQGETIRGETFTCVHAGPMAEWENFRLDPPSFPRPVRGKMFLQELLGSAGLEMSLNSFAPGKGMPFFHKHQNNEEVYIIVGGRGQFLVDGKCIDVQEGSVLRISPAASRAWRNNSDRPLYFLCLQYRADSIVQGTLRDGLKVEGAPSWPE